MFFDVKELELDYLKDKLDKNIEGIFLKTPLNSYTFIDKKFKNIDALSVFVSSDLTKEVLSQFKNLKYIFLRCVGFSNIDLKYCEENNIKTVNINQGYARCSTLVLNEKALITSDLSIEKALKKDGVEVLLISSGNIILDGYDYGFIGGASGKIDENTVVFLGNVTNHPDYRRIENFCENHNISIKIICKDMPLTDIGGIVKI